MDDIKNQYYITEGYFAGTFAGSYEVYKMLLAIS